MKPGELVTLRSDMGVGVIRLYAHAYGVIGHERPLVDVDSSEWRWAGHMYIYETALVLATHDGWTLLMVNSVVGWCLSSETTSA